MGSDHSVEARPEISNNMALNTVDESKLFDLEFRLDLKRLDPLALNKFDALQSQFGDASKRADVRSLVETKSFPSLQHDRAFGVMYGLVIGDALGAPLEFYPLAYDKTVVTDFKHESIWSSSRFQLKPGQWTDDASMSLCVADSLLIHQQLNPIDLRLRFLNWWTAGYNNAFDGRPSCGLGGNIGASLQEFIVNRGPETKSGDSKTSGNGSLMRLGPVPIFYAQDQYSIEEGMEVAKRHSYTTHAGHEAAECCRLMTYIIIKLIRYQGDNAKEDILDKLHESDFTSELYSIRCLLQSKQEESHESNKDLDLADRNWNWKDPSFKYSPNRSREMPGYIGSYAMDGFAMSLHCLYHTDSFKDALIKVINLRGDADTVGAITGQMAGALYGFKSIPDDWVEAVERHDKHKTIGLRAWLLYTRETW